MHLHFCRGRGSRRLFERRRSALSASPSPDQRPLSANPAPRAHTSFRILFQIVTRLACIRERYIRDPRGGSARASIRATSEENAFLFFLSVFFFFVKREIIYSPSPSGVFAAFLRPRANEVDLATFSTRSNHSFSLFLALFLLSLQLFPPILTLLFSVGARVNNRERSLGSHTSSDLIVGIV